MSVEKKKQLNNTVTQTTCFYISTIFMIKSKHSNKIHQHKYQSILCYFY